MRVIVIGGTGTIGAAVASIARLLEGSDDVGAVVSFAASAPLTRLSDERFIASIYVAAVEGGMSGEILRPGA